jgi:hypothetical protein
MLHRQYCQARSPASSNSSIEFYALRPIFPAISIGFKAFFSFSRLRRFFMAVSELLKRKAEAGIARHR